MYTRFSVTAVVAIALISMTAISVAQQPITIRAGTVIDGNHNRNGGCGRRPITSLVLALGVWALGRHHHKASGNEMRCLQKRRMRP